MCLKQYFFPFFKSAKGVFLIFFVFIIVLGFIWFYLSNRDKSVKTLKIGFITDAHCKGDFAGNGEWELADLCLDPLLAFKQNMNKEFYPDVVLDGGDLIEGSEDFQKSKQTFLKARGILNRIKAPVFFVLGNHELDRFTKKQWLDFTDQKNTYYFFDKNGYRVIVLDGNFLKLTDGKVREIDINPSNKFYPGYVNSSQIEWLERLLQNSKDYRKIVFIHQPPLEKTTVKQRQQLLLNYEQLNKLFEKHNVLAVFSGHIEEFCRIKKNNVDYFTLQGFVKGQQKLAPKDQFENQGLFYQIMVQNNQVKVKAYYKKSSAQGYDFFEIEQQNVVCNNQSLGIEEGQKLRSNWQKIKNMVLND